MKTKPTFIQRAVFLVLFSTLNFHPSTASAQGTAFTYQGRLNDGSGPANGTYDITFALFAASSGGVPIATPVTNSATAVSNGLFTAKIDFGGAFDGTARWLEIGVRTNTGGAFTTLTPRQPLTPAPYAVFAGGASAAGLTGTIPAGNIASGSISASQLAPGAVVSNLNASGQAGVASGGTILSASNNSTALMNAGYVKIGVIQSGDIWQPQTGGTPPSVRYSHTAVWTGGEMIVWGGFNGTPLNDGGRFNPSGNGGLGGWTSLASATGPSPAARFEHTAIWTGTEMIVWGGSGASSFLNDGGRYNPTANSWTAVTTTAAPAARANHAAVWTGAEMIVWGGNSNTTYYADGGRFNPAGNGGLGSWTSLASATGTPPAARANHTAVWTGSDMIVWGGWNGSTYFGDGFRYNPASNTWTTVANTGPLVGRRYHTAVWTGSDMLIWGGAANFSVFNDGARYNPATNGWTAVPALGAPIARYTHTAVWTGGEMIVWGGEGTNGFLNDGGRYSPTANSWSPVSANSGLLARALHTAVWTGGSMLVWGGYNGNFFNDTWSYSPGSVMFLYQKP